MLSNDKVENKLRFLFSVGDNPRYVYESADGQPVQEWININVTQADFDGTYKLQIFMNGTKLHEVDNPSPNVYENVTAYAAGDELRPADGLLKNLLILPGIYFCCKM